MFTRYVSSSELLLADYKSKYDTSDLGLGKIQLDVITEL